MAIHSSLNLVVAALAVAAGCTREPAGDQLTVGQASQSQPRPSTTPGSTPSPSPDTVPLDSLLARVSSGSADRRAEAARALGRSGSRVEERLRALAGALRDTDREVGLIAARALGKLAPASVPTLVTALSDHDPDIRRRAVVGLGRAGQAAAAAKPAVLSAMRDPDESVRDLASQAMRKLDPLASLGAASPDTPLDSLLARTRSGSEASRVQAVRALAQPGPRMEERLRTLAAALRDTNRAVGLTAAAALAKLAPASVPTLMVALADHNPDTRRRAVFALGQSRRADTATAAVRSAMSDPDRSVRDMASWAITQLGPLPSSGAGSADLGTTGDLRAGLAAPDPKDRLSAIQRYQPFADDDPSTAVRLLIRALGDGDASVRSGAADQLVIIGPPSRPQLTAALADPNPLVRREASVTLVRLGRGGP